MVNYEVAVYYVNKALYYEYDREKLKKKLNKLLKAKNKVKKIGEKHE